MVYIAERLVTPEKSHSESLTHRATIVSPRYPGDFGNQTASFSE
jgi:hypothetical protein